MKNIITAAIIAMTAAPALADETSTDKCHLIGMTAALVAEKRDEGIPLTDMLGLANDVGLTDLVLTVYKHLNSSPSEFYTVLKDACKMEPEQSK